MQASLPEQADAALRLLEQHPRFVAARRILLYHSLPDEVDTHRLIERYQHSKTLYLPTVVDDTTLELHAVDPSLPMRQGAFGILEANGPILPPRLYHTIDLAIIPGQAFDLAGNRMGRGRGYYDRLLPQLQCHTIGLCYPYQLIDNVPHDIHDARVDEVVCSETTPTHHATQD